jgi:probable HAF family extracellular repeat protein
VPSAEFGNTGYEAFVWREVGGIVGIGDLPGGIFESNAHGISSNGRFVIGDSSVDRGREAFIWTVDDGMTGLGSLNPDFPFSTPIGVSDNGIVVGTSLVSREIVGYHEFANQPIYKDTIAAFIWDAAHGIRDLKSVLEHEYGLDLTGWQLASAVGISDDGQTISGNGINPSGQHEAWSVRLQTVPEPSSLLLLFAAASSSWRSARCGKNRRYR